MQIFLTVSAGAWADDYSQRGEVQVYIDELVAQHKFDRGQLIAMFANARRQNTAIRVMDSQPEAKPWYEYSRIFLNDARVKNGVNFWKVHTQTLARIEREYLVPASIVLAIAGVETNYGKNLGRMPVFDVLVTLGFDYPRRSDFFRKELTEFLLLSREEDFDLGKIEGSVSGAVGFSQFMPGSYRYYAVDFDGDDRRNLWQIPDALASIANYLAKHGWEYGGAIASRIDLEDNSGNLPVNKGLKPWLSLAEARGYGVAPGTLELDENESLFSILAFEAKSDVYEYWATYHNFYVISRYNHSRRYAMAVYQLSRLLRQRYLGVDGG